MTMKRSQMTRSRTAQAAPPRTVPREAPLPQETVAIIKELVNNAMKPLIEELDEIGKDLRVIRKKALPVHEYFNCM